MKALVFLMLPLILCSACTALPAEERAFAVALCVEKTEVWRVHGRIPTYQTGGGYMTVSGEGETFAAALSAMDAAAPMRINLSQLRLLAADVDLARNAELPALLSALADRHDMRLQCAVALTDTPLKDIVEALKPTAGARLSKALDLMLTARVEQGATLPAALADLLRMGERQSPVLAALSLEGQELILAGGYTMDGLPLIPDEISLLSLLMGHAKSLQLDFPGGSAVVRDAAVRIRLSEDLTAASVAVNLSAPASSFTEDGLEQALADALLALLMRLSSGGCDALGLGRQAILHTRDMATWHALNWPETYRGIRWEVAVGVNGPA